MGAGALCYSMVHSQLWQPIRRNLLNNYVIPRNFVPFVHITTYNAYRGVRASVAGGTRRNNGVPWKMRSKSDNFTANNPGWIHGRWARIHTRALRTALTTRKTTRSHLGDVERSNVSLLRSGVREEWGWGGDQGKLRELPVLQTHGALWFVPVQAFVNNFPAN